jgi:hypothetical protein
MLTSWRLPTDELEVIDDLGTIPAAYDEWNTSPPVFAEACH